ncbi:MAG: putative lipid II flippase FtsW [Oscillospiraceae bacterium]|jgi:cell division protein FtsW|nr:putative lipid II flippase FtsW [Oscillospiraceae bacterium]
MDEQNLPEAAEQGARLEQVKREMTKPPTGPMDLPFALLVILLNGIGLVMMFSASYALGEEVGPAYYVTRQGIYLLLGIAVMMLVSRFNYAYFSVFSVPGIVISVLLLILVLFVGSNEKGAVRWINLGLFNVQPSEIAKIAVIVMFATMISARPDRFENKRLLPTVRSVAPFLGILVVITGLIALEPHFSAMILILAVGGVMLFMGGLAYRWIIAVGGLGAAGMFVLINFTEYASARIAIWQDPWSDLRGDGWQTVQSLYAIASGGWLGHGLGQSRQKFFYLPEPHNDFIFSVVCEELGLFGAFLVLFLFMLLIVRGFWIALHARDRFGTLLVSGVTTLLAIQVFLNVAVVTNLIPVTGISMPFFSYGGTSLVIQMAEMGIILAVSRQIPAYSPA